MALPVFARLAKRFSECQNTVDLKKAHDFRIEKVMEAAGKLLFNSIESRTICLSEIPKWLTTKPMGTRIYTDRHNEPVECNLYFWAAYWWFAVSWLSKHRMDSGIPFPARIKHADPKRYMGDFVGEVLPCLVHMKISDENLQQVWIEIAKASEDACQFFASLAVSNKKSTTLSDKKEKMFLREADIATILHKDPKAKLKDIANKLEVSISTVSRSNAWRQNKSKPTKDQFPDYTPSEV